MPDPVLPKRFRFIRELGQGGMGVVYEALDVEQGARVAVKTMRDLTAESLARFKAEFRALADLHHPNIVTLGELLSEGTGWFFTMELVEGSDFLAYVRPGEARLRAAEALAPARRPSEAPLALAPTLRLEGKQPSYDEGRLRSALRQLTEALSAMHAAGVIHRDIKPSNIRVTPAGRLVVLDFGLATDSATGASIGGAIRGTPAYMAPEQGISGSVGPAADWYSVGVVLYEAITGVVPLEGPPLQVLLRKQSHIPEPPRAHVPDVPVDLDALCCRLLSVDPSLRPTTADVQRALGTAETCEASASRSSLLDQGGFVGRAKELAALRDAFDESRSQALSVLVEGESGVGKSCVVKRFVSTLGAELPELVVLAGRCYEREELPYKALDGVVDALVRVLLRSGNELAERIIPTRPGPLAQVFPVLRRVGAFAKAARDPVTRADPVDLRNRAFAAMREMLARLASIRPCVVIIDDLQWADADSFALLEAIMRPPDEPALLLVATVRVAPLGESTAMQKVTGLLSFARSVLAGRTRTIAMLPMPEEDARALTIRLLARGAPGGPQSIEAIAREAGGHPLFIDALVRHSAVAGAGSGGTKLEDALWSRVAGLAVGVRRVMQILAVAGGPITQDVLAAAFGEDRSELGRHVALLRAEHLASSTGARMTDTLEPYHDRVRSAVLANISDEDRAACHRALAVALERAPRRETEALARHWRGAGDTAQAARYSALAADEAAGTLAFDHAVALYETAIELGPRAGDERSALLEKLGDSLSSAGRGERAAVAYAEASRGAQAARSLDLQRRGADQLLRAGHFDEGLAAIGRVLGSIGLRLPRTPLSALLFLLAYRAYLRFRGLGFRARDASEIAATDLTRIDICWSLAFGLALADTVRGAAFNARNLVLALRSGERRRIARAVALEACFLSSGGRRTAKRTNALVERASALARESGDADAVGWAHAAAGIACYYVGRYRRALEHMEHARATWIQVPGALWELDTVAFFSVNCLVQLGQVARVVRETPRAVQEARQRGDLYAAVNLRIGHANIAWLAMDDAEAALAQVDQAMVQWSKRGFHVEHYYELLARTNALVYAGRARDANANIVARWPAFGRSLLPRTVPSVAIYALHARARSAIAAAEEGGSDRASLLASATRDARRIERERVHWANPKASLLRAGVACVEGRRDAQVASLLRDAIAGFEAADMTLYAAAARRCMGLVVGGDEGRALVRDADAWMKGEAIKNPAQMTATLAPGWRRLRALAPPG